SCTIDEAGSDCGPGLACTDRGVCVRYVDFFAIAQGERCRDHEGSLGTCAPGFACAGTGTCVTAPETGATCLSGASGTPSVCGVGHYCDATMLVCLELQADGMPCATASQCQSGTCQAGACGMNATCEPPP